jgi:hypothetical protein
MILIVLTIGIYYPILSSYFEQDAWHNIGWQILTLENIGFWNRMFEIWTSPISPIGNTIMFLNYYLFGVNDFVPAIITLSLVIINTLIWFNIVNYFFKNKILSVLSVAISLGIFIAHQAITWVYPAVISQFSFLFVQLAILSLIKFNNTKLKKHLIYMVLFVLLAISSKLNAFFVIPFLFILNMYLKNNSFDNLINKRNIFIFIFMSIVFLVLFIMFVNPFEHVTRINSNFEQVLINFFVLPLKSITHIIFWQYDMSSVYDTLYWLLDRRYAFLSIQQSYIETILTELLSLVIGILVLLVLTITTYKFNKNLFNIFIIGLLFYWFSFLPFTLDIYSTGNGIMESRYFHPAVYGFGIMVAIFLYTLFNMIFHKNIYFKYIMRVIVILSFISFYYSGIKSLHGYMTIQNDFTNKRKEILEFAKNNFDHDGKFIIFIDDINTPVKNQTGAYFQAGFLYPFLVYSYDNGKINKDFFITDQLWQMNFQGVREEGDFAAGIFYEKNLLKDYILKSNFSINNVYSLTFDYKSIEDNKEAKKFRFINYYDSSKQIQDELQQYKDSMADIIINSKSIHTKTIPNNPYKGLYFLEKNKNSDSKTFHLDNIIIYKDGLEFSYAGAYLKRQINANGAKKYIFRKNNNGINISYIQGVSINGEVQEFDVLNMDKEISLIFKKPIAPNTKIDITFGLNAKVIVYNKNVSDKYILNESSVKFKSTGALKYTMNTESKIVALRMSWLNNKERYQPYVQTKDGMIKIKKWSINENKIDIELEKEIPKDTHITLYVMVKKNLEKIYTMKENK